VTATCLLDNGEFYIYNAASRIDSRPYDQAIFKYIGDGIIGSVNIKGQTVYYKGKTRLSFYVLKKRGRL